MSTLLARKSNRIANKIRPVSPPSSCQRWRFPRLASMASVTGLRAARSSASAAFFSSGVGSFNASSFLVAAPILGPFSFLTSFKEGKPGAICNGVSCKAPNAAA